MYFEWYFSWQLYFYLLVQRHFVWLHDDLQKAQSEFCLGVSLPVCLCFPFWFEFLLWIRRHLHQLLKLDRWFPACYFVKFLFDLFIDYQFIKIQAFFNSLDNNFPTWIHLPADGLGCLRFLRRVFTGIVTVVTILFR